jgi:hypothetical protein
MEEQLSEPHRVDQPLSIVDRPIADLKPDPNNPRLHTRNQIRQIARSIETFGFNAPILIDARTAPHREGLYGEQSTGKLVLKILVVRVVFIERISTSENFGRPVVCTEGVFTCGGPSQAESYAERRQMQIEQLQHENLNKIWQAIRKDKDGARALAILKKHGFDLERIPVTFNTWPGIIVSIPFLPSRRARSWLLSRPYGLRLAIRFLRQLARSLRSPFSRIEASDRAGVIYMQASDEMDPVRLIKTADFLEKVSSWKWVITEHNPRQNTIAYLRWEIKSRTKEPHDTELADLLDATFRAAGFKEGFHMTFESLKKTETIERETRKAARRKLRCDRPR